MCDWSKCLGKGSKRTKDFIKSFFIRGLKNRIQNFKGLPRFQTANIKQTNWKKRRDLTFLAGWDESFQLESKANSLLSFDCLCMYSNVCGLKKEELPHKFAILFCTARFKSVLFNISCGLILFQKAGSQFCLRFPPLTRVKYWQHRLCKDSGF